MTACNGCYPLGQKVGAPQGTVIAVKNLFYNMPARLKFLKSVASEKRLIDEFVTRYALAYPQIRFRLTHDSRVTFQSSGSGDLLDALTAVYGPETARQLLPIQEQPGKNHLQVSGYVGPPGLNWANRSHMTLYVNGRWIKDNHKASGKPRVGFVYSPTAWGRDGTPEGIAYAKKLGFDVVAEIEYPYTATSATSECMQLRKAKAQYVVYHGYSGAGAYTAIFFKTAKKVLKGVQLMGTHYTTGRFPILVAQEAFDGYVGVATRPFSDAVPRANTPMDNPMVKVAHDFAKKYRPDEYAKGLQGGGIKDMFLYMEGLTYALMIQKVLVEADNNGELTREGVNKTLDNMIWDFKGMFGGKLFSYKSHTIPMLRIFKAKVKMVKIQTDDGEKMVPTGGVYPISDWINTDMIEW